MSDFHRTPSGRVVSEFDWDVLVPAFNAETTIAETIRSAANQSRPPKRILVYDDGSRDGTVGVARGAGAEVLADADGINRGVGYARGALLKEAMSDWVLILDADDRLLPHAVACVSEYADLLLDADCISFTSIDNDSGELLEGFHTSSAPRRLSHEDLLRANTISSSATFIRRSAAIRVGGFRPLRRLVDYEFWLRLSRENGAIFQVDVPIAARRLSATSITASVESAVLAEQQLIATEYARTGRDTTPLKREFDLLYRGMSRHVDYGFSPNSYFRGTEAQLGGRGSVVVRSLRAFDGLIWRISRKAFGQLAQRRPRV